MFGWFKRREQTTPTRLLSDIDQLSDDTAVALLSQTCEGHDTVAALFLVAYINFNVYAAAFFEAERQQPTYGASLRGMANYLADGHAKKSGDQVLDAIAGRRLFYLYLSALLKHLHARSIKNPPLWDAVAKIWVGLLPGGRALRATLDKTELWGEDETVFFSDVLNEDDGEQYVRSLLVPEEIRYHDAFKEWDERGMTQEAKDSIAKVMRLFRGDYD